MIPGMQYDWRSRQLARLASRAHAHEDRGELDAAATRLVNDRLSFMSSLSHALLTPLQNISGYAQLLDAGVRGPLTGDQRHDIRRIQANERHLMHLVNSVISFARWEDEVEVRLEDVSIATAVRDTQPLVVHVASSKGLCYRIDASALDESLMVRAEATRLHAILLQLLLNAVKFSRQVSVISLHALAVGECVWIRVTDSGIGISEADVESIFEPFARADDVYVAAQDGDGLGLSISRKLARAMGGEIAVTSVVGEGSTFTLALPRGRGASTTPST